MSGLGDRYRLALLGFCVALTVALAATASATSEDALAAVPFRMVNSRVVIPVSISGSPPLNFVFDNASGGTIVHSSAAASLNLGGATPVIVGEGASGLGEAQTFVGEAVAAPEGTVQIVDVQIVMGEATAVQMELDPADTANLVVVSAGAMQVAEGDSVSAVHFVAGSSGVVVGGQSVVAQLSVGGLVLDDVELATLPLAHLEMPTGEPIDGIIGYDILKEFVVQVDYDTGVLLIFDRDTYVPAEGAAPHEVAFLLGNMAQPCVSGEIALPNGDIVSGMFVLDAGAGADVVLNTPFVREQDLVSKLGAADSPTDSVSGVTPDESPVVRSTLPSFTFCGFSHDSVPVTLNLGTTGFLAGERYAGVIGNRILSRYNITYDYAGGVVYLEPVDGP